MLEITGRVEVAHGHVFSFAAFEVRCESPGLAVTESQQEHVLLEENLLPATTTVAPNFPALKLIWRRNSKRPPSMSRDRFSYGDNFGVFRVVVTLPIWAQDFPRRIEAV